LFSSIPCIKYVKIIKINTLGGEQCKAEDLFDLKVVSDPQMSPDGKLIAYVQTIMDPNSNESFSRIWVVATDGTSDPRLLTSGPGSDYDPRWSPDGLWLVFISTRGGIAQLWILPSMGGEAQ
jgi:Tol biopolymer transport system component